MHCSSHPLPAIATQPRVLQLPAPRSQKRHWSSPVLPPAVRVGEAQGSVTVMPDSVADTGRAEPLASSVTELRSALIRLKGQLRDVIAAGHPVDDTQKVIMLRGSCRTTSRTASMTSRTP